MKPARQVKATKKAPRKATGDQASDRSNKKAEVIAMMKGGKGATLAEIVVRSGTGLYYDRNQANIADLERSLLAPRGVGRAPNLSGSGVPNPLSGIPGVPLGTALDFRSGPTAFTAADLLAILPAIRADQLRRRGDPNNRDFSIRNIEVDKQAGLQRVRCQCRFQWDRHDE